ncbi:riboflavin biosynthesis protein [Lasiosphaeris hirsuta]|uniref:2,5-diamino-6-ribosylamino-4(3H)-pyrimidinone 5'-phosphate reductase n=1 Tax=Lasiosphaeris hirsuta TaxID=260670 RepID=A0AA40AH86_9PEZI|nr:riboflavin biosynthesis protein [Lasiosphaeris hirsuta]
MDPSAEALTFPPSYAIQLEPHLPPLQPTSSSGSSGGSPLPTRPFVTLTFATSLDSSLALAPGVRTVLSGAESKAMTHYLRSRHAAICVGVGTAVADDPGLNCRLSSPPGQPAHHPRPVVIDPHCRWDFTAEAKVLQLARAGRGLAPFVVTAVREPPEEKLQLLEGCGGRFIYVAAEPGAPEPASGDGAGSTRLRWADVLAAVKREGLDSIMIEGGGYVINSLLVAPDSELIDSVIITIAPTWLGQGGVVVSPPRTIDADGKPTAPLRLTNVSWHPLGEDVVMCGKILR